MDWTRACMGMLNSVKYVEKKEKRNTIMKKTE